MASATADGEGRRDAIQAPVAVTASAAGTAAAAVPAPEAAPTGRPAAATRASGRSRIAPRAIPAELRGTLRRIAKEYAEMMRDPPSNCTAAPVANNLLEWRASITGPGGSPYAGGVFKLDIKFPKEYPFKPPKIKFATRIYHCNVSSGGDICLDILKDQWSPALSLSKVLVSLSSLLTDPNPADPLDAAIAQVLLKDRAKHDLQARNMTRKFAK